MASCRESGCGLPIKSRLMCNKHYLRWLKGADASDVRPRLLSVEERLDHYSRREGGCLLWTGSLEGGGYGLITVDGRSSRAHRVVWEREHGPIPDDMVVDHLCHERRCIEPSHLRLATRQENARNRAGATALSSTGVRGVYRHRDGYVAAVKSGDRRYSRSFDTLESAEAAALEIRKEWFGEFAGKG